VVYGVVSIASPGNVAGTGLTVIDLYVPTLILTGIIFLGIFVMPTTLVKYREMGWLRRVSTTPEPPSRLLAAQLVLNLVLASAAILIVIFGGELIFGAPLDVDIPYFVLSVVLSIAVIFSLGLVVAALAPSQTLAAVLAALLGFLSLFFAGLWIQPVQLGEPLATIMYYSPSGAADAAILYSVFNVAPPIETIVTMVIYTVIFAFIAISYFRWE
jgi:ABC-2 type transport system permease protein